MHEFAKQVRFCGCGVGIDKLSMKKYDCSHKSRSFAEFNKHGVGLIIKHAFLFPSNKKLFKPALHSVRKLFS